MVPEECIFVVVLANVLAPAERCPRGSYHATDDWLCNKALAGSAGASGRPITGEYGWQSAYQMNAVAPERILRRMCNDRKEMESSGDATHAKSRRAAAGDS
jgi:hypothetical protein